MGDRLVVALLLGFLIIGVFSTSTAFAFELPFDIGNLPPEYLDILDLIEDLENKNKSSSGTGSSFDHLTRPTFGVSHESDQVIVDDGFRLNNKTMIITDNYHTPFPKQPIKIGEITSLEAKIYAEKNLKVQEFLFGIPEVGNAHLAEAVVEVWIGYDGEIEDVKVIQESNVIDENSITATHEKVQCKDTDVFAKCDQTKVSLVFLEHLKDSVMGVKAIDYKNRYQITYLNEGVDILGESLNPAQTAMIPSPEKGEGQIKVTQTSKYSPLWVAEDGREFMRNEFNSFWQINKKAERFQDSGNAFSRTHSSFGGILDYEQKRAINLFDSRDIVSQMSDTFTYEYDMEERVDSDMKETMLEQEEIAKKYLESTQVQARFN